jgi:hypothetical protein
MSDNEDEEYDDTNLSDTSEPELDEVDQNDDVDANADLPGDAVDADVDDYDEDENIIYGPLRALKIRDGDHIIIVVIPESEKQTSNVISLPEYAEATGIRASQIERGSPVFTDCTGISSPIARAHKEFRDRKNPLVLERCVEIKDNVHYVEHWRVREMTYTDQELDQ